MKLMLLSHGEYSGYGIDGIFLETPELLKLMVDVDVDEQEARKAFPNSTKNVNGKLEWDEQWVVPLVEKYGLDPKLFHPNTKNYSSAVRFAVLESRGFKEIEFEDNNFC